MHRQLNVEFSITMHRQSSTELYWDQMMMHARVVFWFSEKIVKTCKRTAILQVSRNVRNALETGSYLKYKCIESSTKLGWLDGIGETLTFALCILVRVKVSNKKESDKNENNKANKRNVFGGPDFQIPKCMFTKFESYYVSHIP